jgi:hypothetical protein
VPTFHEGSGLKHGDTLIEKTSMLRQKKSGKIKKVKSGTLFNRRVTLLKAMTNRSQNKLKNNEKKLKENLLRDDNYLTSFSSITSTHPDPLPFSVTCLFFCSSTCFLSCSVVKLLQLVVVTISLPGAEAKSFRKNFYVKAEKIWKNQERKIRNFI